MQKELLLIFTSVLSIVDPLAAVLIRLLVSMGTVVASPGISVDMSPDGWASNES